MLHALHPEILLNTLARERDEKSRRNPTRRHRLQVRVPGRGVDRSRP